MSASQQQDHRLLPSLTFPIYRITMKTALVLITTAASLSCTLAFVPLVPVNQRQRSAVRYVKMMKRWLKGREVPEGMVQQETST